MIHVHEYRDTDEGTFCPGCGAERCAACRHDPHDEDPCAELIRAGMDERMCGCIE